MDVEKIKAEITCRLERIPRHIAIIMDGNGRWARIRNKPRTFGHEAGVTAAREVVRAAVEIGVKFVTLYTFSVENWRRPKSEVNALMSLLSRAARDELDDLVKNDVKLITIGRTSGLPIARRKILEHAVKRTRSNKGLMLILALNYGGRTEILDAVKAIASSVKAGMLSQHEIDEALFSDFLYTADIPDPDLLIRTSGEMRISNFLPWQTAYTELYIIDTLWPDFGRAELFQAVQDYQKRDRRFGRVTSEIDQ